MRHRVLLALAIFLLIVPARALSQHPLDIYWDYRFDVLGLDHSVHALFSDGGDLYVGGEFRYAGDVLVKKIARWDGTQWHALGSGVFSNGNYVADITGHAGDVYACGTFEQIGDVAVNHVAGWDGNNWFAVGDGVPAAAYALASYDGQLYAGGAGFLMRWNGSSWTDAGNPGAAVRDLSVSGSDILACGTFTSLGGTPALRVARGDGSSWWPLGDGLDGSCSPTVFALCSSGGDAYAVGQFSSEPGGASLGGIGHWDGAHWQRIGPIGLTPTGMCDVPFGLAACEFGDGVAVGGYWETIDGQDIPFLAWWSGYWVALGSGVNYSVNALCQHDGALVVGGGFTQGGGKTSRHIGMFWLSNPPTAVKAQDAGLSLAQNTPNPFNPTTRFEFRTDRYATVTLAVFDAKGRVVRTLLNGHVPAGNHTAEWDGHDDNGARVPSGVYFYRLRRGTETLTRKAVLVK